MNIADREIFIKQLQTMNIDTLIDYYFEAKTGTSKHTWEIHTHVGEALTDLK